MPGTNKLHRRKNACGFPKVEQKETQCILSVFNGLCVDFFNELLLGTYYMHRKTSCSGQVSCFWGEPTSGLLCYHFGNSFTCLGERLVLFPIIETSKGCEDFPQGERGFQEEVLEQRKLCFQGSVHEPDWRSW